MWCICWCNKDEVCMVKNYYKIIEVFRGVLILKTPTFVRNYTLHGLTVFVP